MKILHILDHSLPLHSGYTFRSQNIFKAQQQMGYTPVFNGINPLELKPVPPDPAFQQERDLKDKKVIGFVGSFYRYEGLDLLITAFAKIAASHDNARLLQSPWKPWPWKKPWWPVTWAATKN